MPLPTTTCQSAQAGVLCIVGTTSILEEKKKKKISKKERKRKRKKEKDKGVVAGKKIKILSVN